LKVRRGWLLAIAVVISIVPASAEAASIGGTVSAAGGGPLEGIQVCAAKSFSGPQCAATGADGNYSIAGLADGTYTVEFDGGADYVDRWFDGATKQGLADPVIVAGGDATGIDAYLEPAGRIAGTVVDAASGEPVEGAFVCAFPEEGYGFNGPCPQTDSEGKYTLGGLAAGSYVVEFRPGFDPASRDYLGEYFDDAHARNQAVALAVTPGATVGGVDAALEEGARITGTVSDEDGQPVEGVQVCAEPLKLPNRFGECATSAADGTYEIHRVQSGDYRVRFTTFPWQGNYLGQYYDDQTSRQLATAVHAAAPATVAGIDATLHPGGWISGTISTADTASPLNQAEACAIAVGGNGREYCAHSAADGTYAIGSLPTGSYEVLFSPAFMDRQYASERYDDQPSGGNGQQLAVTAGGTVAGIDAALSRGASISGHVEDAVSGDPVKTISVCPLLDGEPIDEFESCVFTDAGGDYELLGLDPGAYTVRFKPGIPFGPVEPADPRYATRYYDGASTLAAAQPIVLTAGQGKAGVDAQLSFGSTVSGTITGPGGAPVPSGYVCTVVANEEESRCGWANKRGEYAIEGLSAGNYVLRFGANPEETPGWLTEYWDDRPSAALADPLSVSGTPVEIDEVDAELTPAGAIAGRVTAATTGLPIQSAFVCAIPDGATEASNCSETWGNGRYLIPTLASGSYRVEFSVTRWEEDEGPVEEFRTQWFPGAGSLGTGALVSVVAGSTTNSIDAAMADPADPGPSPGGSEGDPGTNPPPAGSILPPPMTKPLKPHCRKRFKARKVRGRWRCVKKRKHRPHRHKQR
jgi:Carboxypeptidase regulatory-like domain